MLVHTRSLVRHSLVITTLCAALTTSAAAEEIARGVVYEDRNANSQRDAGEPGLVGIRVSNGAQIVRTDAEGRYALPVTEDSVVYVLKPRDYMTPLNADNLPQFYYVYMPAGSPKMKYGGVPATGALPASIDFPLIRSEEPNKFDVVFFGDTQPYSQEQVDFIGHDIVEELIGVNAAFGVTLGDVVGDHLNLFEPLNRTIAHIGIPWHYVMGNHDIDYDALDDGRSDDTFTRVYGPPYYSFDYSAVHFIVIDNVHYRGKPADKANGGYYAELGEKQLAFLANDLKDLQPDQFIVLMFHIPIWEVKDLDQLFALLKPFRFTLSLAAHTHTHINRFIDADGGWQGQGIHHHLVAGTTCGSWWKGVPDEYGIPHTMMRDGTPNGYIIATFEADTYKWRYKVARRPADFQMAIFTPEAVECGQSAQTEVVANVFNGTNRSTVKMRVRGHGDWITMKPDERSDPYYAALKDLEADTAYKLPGSSLPGLATSTHIWVANLPADLPAGSHLIEVQTTDMFNQSYTGYRIFRVTPGEQTLGS